MVHLGRKADVVTRDSLHRALRPTIEAAPVRVIPPRPIAVLGAW